MLLSRPILAIFTLLLFAVATLSGLHAAMMTDGHGNMFSCPLMSGSASFCRMNIVEHLSAWQSLFATVIPSVIPLLLAFVLLLISTFSKIHERNRHVTTNFLYNKRRDFIAFIFNPIRLALSRGILHTKIYDSAVI